MRRAALALLTAALAVGGCGGTDPREAGPAAGGDAGTAARLSSDPLQAANGPVAAGLGPRPLAVKLADPRDAVRAGFKPRAGLLFDLDTGQVLWRRDPTRVLPIASLTKMMTALVVADQLPSYARVPVTSQALRYQGSGVGVLPRGKQIAVSTMLHGLLLPSGNDAAIALAQRTSGTTRRFITAMNARGQRMALQCTHYTSVDGFRDAGNHSCALDLAAEARAILDTPRLARIVRRRQAALPFPIKGGKLFLNNNNPLLRTRYPGTLGIKTGYTDRAGRCLVAAARRGSRRLGVVLLHSPDPGGQARVLLDRGFAALHAR